MRTVFFGTPEIAVPSLAALSRRHEVGAVVCQPDRPQGHSNKPVPPPVKLWAAERGIPVHQPEKLNDGSFEAWLKAQAPEICVLAAYGRFIKQPILDVPDHGFINMHPSLLPRRRGPSPIQTAILEGDTVTGVTIIRLTPEMDAGDILLQEESPILDDDTTVTLTERLALLGAELVPRALDLIASGRAVWRPQDHSKATVTKLFEKSDGAIRWDSPARAIHNLVRAALPWPVAHGLLNGEVLRIHKTAVLDEPAGAAAGAAPGAVTRVETGRLVVATGEGALAILAIQPPGKRPMPVADYLRGHPLDAGVRFEGV